MNLKILPLTFLFAVSALAAPISRKEFNDLKKKYAQGLPVKKGADEEVWSRVLEGIKKFNDEKMAELVLAHYPPPGIDFERHRLDALEVFKHDPVLALRASNKVFNQNQDCLLNKILPRSEQISYLEVRPSLSAAIERLEKDKKRGEDLKLLLDFRKRADAHYQAIQSKTAKLKTGSCFEDSSKYLTQKK